MNRIKQYLCSFFESEIADLENCVSYLNAYIQYNSLVMRRNKNCRKGV